jgi:poly-gamma-glutamate capsule biosynthesis protein CapA/YwtB (metallophosphatase superfamily)
MRYEVISVNGKPVTFPVSYELALKIQNVFNGSTLREVAAEYEIYRVDNGNAVRGPMSYEFALEVLDMYGPGFAIREYKK